MKKILPFSGRKQKQAFDALLLSHTDRLYRLAYRFCGNRDDAEDLVQDLLLKLYPRQDELMQLEQPGPWLAKALYNLFVDNVRRYQRSPVQLLDTEELDRHQQDSGETTPHSEHAREQRLQRLQTLFSQLNTEHRMLLAMHDIEGYSLPELEKMLGTPLGTLKSRLHRARNHLKELIKKDGTI